MFYNHEVYHKYNNNSVLMKTVDFNVSCHKSEDDLASLLEVCISSFQSYLKVNSDEEYLDPEKKRYTAHN